MSIALLDNPLSHPCMGRFGDTILRLRKERHLSQREVAESIGTTVNTIRTWEGMDSSTIRGTHYRKLAEAFGMTTADLDREWRAGKIEQSVGDPVRRGIPVINKAPAGNVVDYEECSMADSGQGQWYVARSGIEDPHAFAVIVTGDSMEPFLLPKTVAIFSPMDMDGYIRHKRILVNQHHVLFVRFGGDAPKEGCCIARWSMERTGIKLTKDNAKYKPKTYKTEWIVQMAALVNHDDVPGVRQMFSANENLTSKSDGTKQVEGQIHPDMESQVHPNY